MKLKMLKDFINSLEEKDLQREIMFNRIEDNLDTIEKVSLSTDESGNKILLLTSEFGYYGLFEDENGRNI